MQVKFKFIPIVIFFSVKIISQPNIEWWKNFETSTYSTGQSVVQTIDSGYIIGATISTIPQDVFIIKTDKNGDTLWTKQYGGSGYETCNQIIQTNDEGYAIVGYTNSFGNGQDDFLLIKMNKYGSINWVKPYGGANSDYGHSIVQTNDGGYILCGSTKSYGNGNFYIMVVKTNNIGEVEWTKYFGNGNYDFARTIIQLETGEYVIAGETDSFGSGNIDIVLIKLNSSGNVIWSINHDISQLDFPYSIKQTYDNGYIISGETNPGALGGVDIILVKTNSEGIKEWHKFYGGIAMDRVFEVEVTKDSGFVMCGTTTELNNSEDGIIIKTNKNGDQTWLRKLTEIPYFPRPLNSISVTNDNGYIVTGTSNGSILLVKLESDPTIVNVMDNAIISYKYELGQNYPNPFNPTTTIKYSAQTTNNIQIKIFNSIGQLLKTLVNETKTPGEYSIVWNGEDDSGSLVASGAYFYQIQTKDFISSKKMILLK